MNYDTLEYNGRERSFAAWGFALDSCRSRRGNLKADTFTATIPGAHVGDDPVFPYEAAVIVRTNRASGSGADNSFSGGVTKFQGKRVSNPLKATGQYEGVSYEFQGPWYDLDITQYLQTFKGVTTNYNPGEVVLNTAAFPQISTGGLRFISVGDQIQCILQFVLDSYAALGLPAPFKYVGRDLTGGAINLNTTGAGRLPADQNTDAGGAVYINSVNAGTTIDLSLFKLFLKSDIIRPMSATQCLQKLLEWSPRTNLAFDYTTTPPTVFFCNIDNATAVNLALFDGIRHKSIDLQRRDDLVPVSVVIGYRITATVGGQTEVDYAVDKWPPTAPSQGPGVVVQTLDLQGFSISFSTGQLTCEPLACIGGTHKQRRAWWVSKVGGETEKLATTKVRFQAPDPANPHSFILSPIPDAKVFYAAAGFDSTGAAVAQDQEFTAADYAFFTKRLVRGTQHAWMVLGDGTPVKSVKAKISAANVTYAEYDVLSGADSAADPAPYEIDAPANAKPRRITTDLHVTNIELTNGVSGNYSTVESSTPGEAFIIGAGGIAQYLFTMLSTIQYEGEFVKVESDFSNNVSLINAVNFTGGRAEWAGMRGQIQDIIEDWGRKETSVRIGVSKHLSADQLSALLNMSRFRRPWFNPLVKADNTVASSGEIAMPVTAGQSNSVEGVENVGQLPNTLYTTPPSGVTPGVVAGQLNHDPQKIADKLAETTPTPVDSGDPNGIKIMEPRECVFCDESGALMWAIAHVTGFYTKP